MQFLNLQFKVKAMKIQILEIKVFQGLTLNILEIQGNFKGNSFKAKGNFSRVNQYFQFKVKAVKNQNLEFMVFQHLTLKILEIQGNFKGNSFKAKGQSSRANQCYQFKVFHGPTLENLEISRQLQGCTFQ